MIIISGIDLCKIKLLNLHTRYMIKHNVDHIGITRPEFQIKNNPNAQSQISLPRSLQKADISVANKVKIKNIKQNKNAHGIL